MASLNRARQIVPSTRGAVELSGSGWGPWRGRWGSGRRLLERAGAWSLEEDGRETDRWPDFRAALRAMWPKRRIRDRSPWLVGWLGYEASARLAGGLPSHEADPSVPGGWFLVEPALLTDEVSAGVSSAKEDGDLRWSLDRDEYCQRVESIRDLVAAGGVYQVNLCRRATIARTRRSLVSFSEAASSGGAPPYMSHIDFGEGELVCASMELLLRRRGRYLETGPIKGTRRRGATQEEDLHLVAELENDPKERAELAMVVDLERNDLGRVCETGSVEVVDSGTVRSFATVHHLVARVRGRALPDLEWWDILSSVAPGGSITGCPKLAAMQVIRDLEPVPRGPFTGALGVVAGNGDMEMALPIRTAWKVGATIEFAAGCGIVWQSQPELEEEESRLKVARWLDLVGGDG